MDVFGYGTGIMTGFCEYDNELWGSIKVGEFMEFSRRILRHGVS